MRKAIVTIGIFLITQGVSAKAQGNGWMPIGESVKGTVWKMRTADVANNTNYSPQVWVTQDHSNDKSVSQRETKSLYRFNCKLGTYRQIASVSYSGDGSVYRTDDTPDYTDKYVTPDSMIEAAVKAACPSD